MSDGISTEFGNRTLRYIRELDAPATPSLSSTHITRVLIDTYTRMRRMGSARFLKFVRWMVEPKPMGSSIHRIQVESTLRCDMKYGFRFMHPLARRELLQSSSFRESGSEFEHLRTEYNEIALTRTSCRESARMHTGNILYVLQSRSDPTSLKKTLGVLCEMCKNNCLWYSMVPLAMIVVITKMYSENELKKSSRCRSELNEIFTCLSSIASAPRGASGSRCASADRARTVGASIICALSEKTIEFMNRGVVQEFVCSMISNMDTINSISPFFGKAYGHVAHKRPRWITYEPVTEAWTLGYGIAYGFKVYGYRACGRKVIIESCLSVACGQAPGRFCSEVRSWFMSERDQLLNSVRSGMEYIPWTSVCNILSFFYGLIHYIECTYYRVRSPISTAIKPVLQSLMPDRCILRQMIQFEPILMCSISPFTYKTFQLLVELIKNGEFDEFWLKYKSFDGVKWPSIMKRIFDMHYRNIEKIRFLAAIFHMETRVLHICKSVASCSASETTKETVWNYMGADSTLRKIMRVGKCEDVLSDLY